MRNPLSLTSRRTLGSLAAAAALAAVALPAHADITRLFVFGDSLSDAAGGNAVPLAPNQGGALIPAPYDGGRVSNGAVAAEYLAQMLSLDAAHTFQFAIAGARSGNNGTLGAGTGVAAQIAAFAGSGLTGLIDADSLFMVWSGANDLRDLLPLGAAAPAQFGTVIGQIASNIGTLYGLGARQFLLPNVPNLGLTPAAQQADLALPGTAAGATALTSGFNGAMHSALAALELSLPGAEFNFADIFSAHSALFASAGSVGITNTAQGCLVPLALLPAPSDCSASFYVDDIHPTTQVHQVVAGALLAAVPEPGSLLLAGSAVLGLIGASVRRQRRQPAVA